jgi:hypothetical protein
MIPPEHHVVRGSHNNARADVWRPNLIRPQASNGANCGRKKWSKSLGVVSAVESGTRRTKIRFLSACVTARTVRDKLERLSLSLWEFRDRRYQFKDKSRRSATPAIAVNQLSGTFAPNAALPSFPTSSPCLVSPSSKLALWTTRRGSIQKRMSIAIVPNTGPLFLTAVRNLRRCPLSVVRKLPSPNSDAGCSMIGELISSARSRCAFEDRRRCASRDARLSS